MLYISLQDEMVVIFDRLSAIGTPFIMPNDDACERAAEPIRF